MCWLKDDRQFIWQMPVISVTLPSSILRSTGTPSLALQNFSALKKPRVDRPQLVEARIAWMRSGVEVKGKKFCFGLFLGECLQEMPRQMGDSRFCALWKISFDIRLIQRQQFTCQAIRWSSRRSTLKTQQVANIAPNSAPTLRKIAVSAIVDLA